MPPREQQRRAPPQERAKEQPRSASTTQSRTTNQTATALEDLASEQKGKSDMAVEEATVTAGKDGARNIRVEWIRVSLPHAQPARFAVTTATGNALEVSMEQKSYRRSYQGTSGLTTDITPVAPHGTRGKLIAHDLATGETLEQPWVWRTAAGGLWELIKRLFT